MSFEQREGSGALFKNKKAKDTHPDYRGPCKIGGTIYDISAWIKEGPKGKYMSLNFQVPKPVGQPNKAPEPPADFDDEIGF